ncbi:unnamed protein product [[Candida] boidinii]|nr:unnamed protein product [[Candida] boidinii]
MSIEQANTIISPSDYSLEVSPETFTIAYPAEFSSIATINAGGDTTTYEPYYVGTFQIIATSSGTAPAKRIVKREDVLSYELTLTAYVSDTSIPSASEESSFISSTGGPAPSSGVPVVPSSGAPVVPSSGAPAVPSSGAPVVPSSGAPVVPSSGAPVVPSSGAPVVPSNRHFDCLNYLRYYSSM